MESFSKPFLPQAAYQTSEYQYPQNYSDAQGTLIGLSNRPQAEKPSEQLTASSGAQRALDFLQQRIGKKINTYPNDGWSNPHEWEIAHFDPNSPMGGGINNSSERDLFLGPRTDYNTLFHEIGHARDPDLRRQQGIETTYRIQGIPDNLSSPSEVLNYDYQHRGLQRVKTEAEAQVFSGSQLPRFAQQNPDLKINYQQKFNDPWFKGYPASYASNTIDQFWNKSLEESTTRIRNPESIDDGRDQYFSKSDPLLFKPDNARKALTLGLDKDLRNTQQNIMNSARSYVDERLNPYQQNPTPWELDYWGAR